MQERTECGGKGAEWRQLEVWLVRISLPPSRSLSLSLSLSLGCFVLSVCLGPMCQSQLGKKFAFYYFVAFIVGIVGTF